MFDAKKFNCTNCIYGHSINKTTTECRLNPPIMTSPDDDFAFFPITEYGSYCGQGVWFVDNEYYNFILLIQRKES